MATSLPRTDGKARPVSRLELLLVSRTSKPVFTPEGNTTESQATNRAIEMSAQWTDVQNAVLNAPVLSFNNLAFAVYRLGCLAAFDSKKRRNGKDLPPSSVIPECPMTICRYLHELRHMIVTSLKSLSYSRLIQV